MRKTILAAGAAVLTASAAHAGGFIAPVVQVEPPVVVAPVAAAWQGAYVGGALGYAFGGDDDIGQEVNGRQLGDLGSAELSGANLTLRGGYRWQRDRWVVGPELSYMMGDIKDSFNLAAGGSFESKVDNVLALKLKTGYLVNPETLVYGIAGWQKGNFTYDNNGRNVDYDADGYVVGFGAERRINERMSVTAEYEYSNFGKTDVTIAPGVNSVATPEFSNVKVGLNFQF